MGGSYRGHCQPPLANVTGAETLRRRAARRLAEAQRRFAALEPRVAALVAEAERIERAEVSP